MAAGGRGAGGCPWHAGGHPGRQSAGYPGDAAEIGQERGDWQLFGGSGGPLWGEPRG